MNERRTFWWKVAYIVAIAILIVPLHALSLPATKDSPGGILAQLRTENGLAEANLGEIDASAETVKLATLGLRGVAVNILWEKANYYKKVEDWTSFGAVLEQIANLQPHFFTVWDYQAHNLTYNTSVEFDDYKDRYDWVIKGINFLKKGKALNTNPRDPRFTEPRITSRIGWFIAQKIGRADEHRQFRRLFKEDDQFHDADNPNRKREDRDNWLVGFEYYKRAWNEVTTGAPLRTTPVIFYSQPMMALIYYADALESDSTAGEQPHFGQVAQQAWKNAGRELAEFGRKDIPSPYGEFIHLDALEDLVAKEKIIEDSLKKVMPGEFDKLKTEQHDKLTAEMIEALDMPTEKRDGGQQTTAFEFWRQVAEKTGADRRGEALKLAGQFEQTELAARDIRNSRDIVNYIYWKTRCDAEPTPAALDAHELTFKAEHEQQEARPNSARKYYDQAFAAWRKVLDQFKVLRDDTLMAQDLAELVDHYRDTLRQLAGDEAKFPEPFVLQDMLDLNERTYGPSQAKTPEKPKATDNAEKPGKGS
ncbi:MAG TPA: hypothetical protein VGY55_03400 [Pirellulales bacterium]|jgi:hypothetical protein|nr:hypothetical protein [Pirellulales bacterium]